MIQSEKSWTKIIKSFAESELGKTDFCKKHNLRANQFYYWCNKLRPDLKSDIHQTRAQKKESAFLPIKAMKKEDFCSIKINNHLEIKFDSLPEPLWIATLLNSIGEIND